MAYEAIIYEKDKEGIATITHNRPHARNAENRQLKDERNEAIAAAQADDDVRVLIITGAGTAFDAGDDIKELWLDPNRQDNTRDRRIDALKGIQRTRLPYLGGFWKPAIAAVNGPAVGAGLETAIECDIRIASENAQFGWFFVRRNLQGTNTPIGLIRMSHIMGLGRAMEFMLSGEMMDAKEALRTGMANMVVPQDKLMDEARAMARKVMQGAPLAQQVIKQMVHTSMFDPTRLADMSSALGGTLRQTEDHMEAARAFAEKREANFKMR